MQVVQHGMQHQHPVRCFESRRTRARCHAGALEPGQDFMMLDVGCNKGFESAALFSIMDPEAGAH